MFYIGLDLAWGMNRQTGIAIVDAQGNLVSVTAALTNEQISQYVTPYLDGVGLVGIDAPLVVNNPSGPRPCEAEVTQIYGKFHAGAHSSSLQRKEFRPRPRGAIISEELGLDIDPTSQALRRAIEVFPHPAIVALFRLSRILKYKDKTAKGKPPRRLEELRPELERLMWLIETQLSERDIALHVRHNSDWQRLKSAVRLAPTKAALGRAEDEVDAVLCAYVARYADLNPTDVVIYGDIETGYIVTPRLPPGLKPGPLQPPADIAPEVAMEASASAFDRALAS